MSAYRDEFIIKGGILVASLVGVENRYTRDIDATIKGFDLTQDELNNRITKICNIDAGDNISFTVKKIGSIRDEDKYSGFRITLDATYGSMMTPVKLDISTGDVVTPEALDLQYKLLLDDSYIELRAYNIETILAEKLNTLFDRYISNTRMRDFYDIWVFSKLKGDEISPTTLNLALINTARNRENIKIFEDWEVRLSNIASSEYLAGLWLKYSASYVYSKGISFTEVCESVQEVMVLSKL
jgi:predicted nucleotidyltransferase component of viral defense system